MPIPELRVAAAQFVLNILNLDELPALLERLVDHDLITPNVADLYTTRQFSLTQHSEKIVRLFRDLCITLPSEKEALWRHLRHQVRSLIEGTRAVDVALNAMIWIGERSEECELSEFVGLYWTLDDAWDEPREVAFRRGAPEALALAREWHRRHGPAFDSAWLRPTVLQLAQAIHAERAFDRLPVLADVLEEAGCTDTDIIEHCRFPNVHPQGCWVIDALLAASSSSR